MNPIKLIAAGVVGVFVFLAAITVGFGSWYTIDAGERGVILRNGAVVGVADAGLHFKMPIIDTVPTISTRTFTVPFPNEPFYSKDQQAATATVSITFHAVADSVADIYTNYGSLDAVAERILTPRVKKEFKEVMGQFNAATAIQERERMGLEVAKAIIGDGSGLIIIDSVQVENIDFSDVYEDAIEARMLAEVEIQTIRQNVEREKATAEITVTKAKAEADSKLAIAEAEAKAIRIKGEAEASAIKARGDALRDNPGLVDLTQAERWDGKLPETMVPGGSVPMLNMGAK